MGRNITKKKNSVTELKKMNCFDVTKYIDDGKVLYELRYEDYVVDTFNDYNDMTNYVKNFDYTLFYQENWKEILDKKIDDYLLETV